MIVTLFPNGEGFYQNGAYQGSPGDYTGLLLDDGDSSYWETQFAARSWTMENMLAEQSTINSVTVKANARKTGTTGFQLQLLVRVAGVDSFGSTGEPGLTYGEHTYAPATAPGGGSWTPALVDAMETGARSSTALAPEYIRVTYQRAEIDFTPPVGAWVSMILSWLGPVVGVGLGLEHMLRLAATIAARTRGRYVVTAAEYAAMLVGLRAPRRVYCL